MCTAGQRLSLTINGLGHLLSSSPLFSKPLESQEPFLHSDCFHFLFVFVEKGAKHCRPRSSALKTNYSISFLHMQKPYEAKLERKINDEETWRKRFSLRPHAVVVLLTTEKMTGVRVANVASLWDVDEETDWSCNRNTRAHDEAVPKTQQRNRRESNRQRESNTTEKKG